MPDRYADAVRARRAELRELRARLGGGHRGELRSCLALSRLAAAGQAAAALAALRREVAAHVRRGDRQVRERLPARLEDAVAAVGAAVALAWGEGLRPPLRRIATERGLAMEPGFPALPPPRAVRVPPAPEPLDPVPSLLTGVVEGAALWRLALLPLAVLPLLGLPALGGAALTPLAVGAGAAAVVVAAVSRRTAAQRARLHRGAEQVLTAAAAAIDADLDRRLVELERAAGAALDTAVLHRRAAVERELARLAADPGSEHDG
ncbi:hypothetical protein [Pseudonocardia sp. MH-G8]|uniref:hypothetical protein n=1 Tax=Pseudonocardia sp. MH-G8 TaxID=1854588 RepID=UPI000BA06BCC|nr:hypothetical protein [Pseudonocardia sp. MH-G8]OZM82931.1 hypothetical protein CFP66_09755 [Pseudonocardia sp. MH-G8]